MKAVVCHPAVEQTRDVGVLQVRENLPLVLKSFENLLRAHAQFDALQRHLLLESPTGTAGKKFIAANKLRVGHFLKFALSLPAGFPALYI